MKTEPQIKKEINYLEKIKIEQKANDAKFLIQLKIEALEWVLEE